MVSIRPHFTVVRPSPTTVSYTVSTVSPQRSLAAHCVTWLSLALRAFLGVLTFSILATKYLDRTPVFCAPLSRVLEPLPWLYVGSGCAVALVLVFRRFHIGELYTDHFWPDLFFCFFLLFFLLLLTGDQKNRSSRSGPWESKRPAFLRTISYPLPRASSRPLRSGISSSMKRFWASR